MVNSNFTHAKKRPKTPRTGHFIPKKNPARGGAKTRIYKELLVHHGVLHDTARNLHAVPDNRVADFDTGKFAIVTDSNKRANLTAMNLRVLADIARRNDFHSRNVHFLGIVIPLEDMRVRIEERFHEPAVEPAGNRSRLELAALLDHHLEGVGELELALGADIVVHEVLEGKQGQVITVCGAGGNRDKGKRPLMAQEAVKQSDRVIITSDNPRFEEPQDIINDMLAGLDAKQMKKVVSIADRREAIKTAVMLAQKGDVILIAGKGHEDYQEIKGVKHHFDDREVVRDIFNS